MNFLDIVICKRKQKCIDCNGCEHQYSHLYKKNCGTDCPGICVKVRDFK